MTVKRLKDYSVKYLEILSTSNKDANMMEIMYMDKLYGMRILIV